MTPYRIRVEIGQEWTFEWAREGGEHGTVKRVWPPFAMLETNQGDTWLMELDADGMPGDHTIWELTGQNPDGTPRAEWWTNTSRWTNVADCP